MSHRTLFCLAAIVASAATGCGAVDDGEAVEAGMADDAAYEGVSVLATVERPNAGVVRFFGSDRGLGVGCDEMIPADGVALPVSSASDPRSCLALFVALTADDVPVPAALVSASEVDGMEELLAHRPLVDALPAPVLSIEPAASPSPQPLTGTYGASPHSCDGTDGSQAHFEAEHCDFSGGSNVISYCDSGQWWDLYRTTAGAGRRNSFEEVLSCTAFTDVIHEYWNGTSWVDAYTRQSIPDDYYHWSRWEGAASWQRRLHVYRVQAAGFFRSHSVFYDN